MRRCLLLMVECEQEYGEGADLDWLLQTGGGKLTRGGGKTRTSM